MLLVAAEDAIELPGTRNHQPPPVTGNVKAAAYDDRARTQDVVQVFQHLRPYHTLNMASLILQREEERAFGRRRALPQDAQARNGNDWRWPARSETRRTPKPVTGLDLGRREDSQVATEKWASEIPISFCNYAWADVLSKLSKTAAERDG